MDERLIPALAGAIERGEPVSVATVIDTSRSVPRHAGSKMLIFRDGRTVGTIGGGEMEARVITEALGTLVDGRPRLVQYDLLSPASGDPGVCGGTVHLYLEPYMPIPTLLVIGCGHVGQKVVELGHWLGFRVVAFDDRPDQITEELVPLADVRLSGDLADALAAVPVTAETHIVVVTRNVGVDLAQLPLLVGLPARSIGVMGSQRRWKETRAQLEAGGVDAVALDAVRSPIGLEIEAETPEEIALSILAQIVGERRGVG